MKNKIALIACVFGFVGCGSGNVKQNVPDQPAGQEERVSLQEYCASNECRKNQLVNFMTDSGEVKEQLELYWPAVQGENISILPGDELYIEALVFEGNVTGFVQVDKIEYPESTIVFEFSQMKGGVAMMLTIHNPFENTIKFHIDMIDFQGNLHPTSSCPVMSKVSSIEHWPHAIPELILSDFHTVAEGEFVSCEY